MLAGCATTGTTHPVTRPLPTADAATRVFLMEDTQFVQSGWTIDGDSRAGDLARLTAWAANRGLIIVTADMEAYEGRTDGHIVVVNGLLSANDRLYTLIHELAHCLQPDGLTQGQAETFAELVAVQVYADDSAWVATANYLRAQVPFGMQVDTVHRLTPQMDAAVTVLRRALK